MRPENPRGIRNFNPGNIRHATIRIAGEDAHEERLCVLAGDPVLVERTGVEHAGGVAQRRDSLIPPGITPSSG